MENPEPNEFVEPLKRAVERALSNREGQLADYIPELAGVDPDCLSAAIALPSGACLTAGPSVEVRFTLQSSAKLILLAGLLEELGEAIVFERVGKEPSGSSFASIARLDTHGPVPANPLVNSGAIALMDLVPGDLGQRVDWIKRWGERLCGCPLEIDERVLRSESLSGDRNRSIAYLLRQNGILRGQVDEVLEAYFSLCSLHATVCAPAHLALVLARGGVASDGQRILSPRVASCVVSLMATCGMYDESGTHLVATGLPAKSGVSGVIVAVAPRRAGIAVWSPRINAKGGSVRGHELLRHLSNDLGWHFALPNA